MFFFSGEHRLSARYRPTLLGRLQCQQKPRFAEFSQSTWSFPIWITCGRMSIIIHRAFSLLLLLLLADTSGDDLVLDYQHRPILM